ncbi:hypothetical protein [Bacillus tuaregi]|uniref:hypothetical protein n=1 Tax=Bacillus tuaregi TaxID=1816695 RepID=UPI0008F7EDC7|nr:hypothetical protein [Bacillus tuaregi]
MTIFFIIISFILNIISLMGIIILFLRQNKLVKVDENQKKTMMEMEELMSSYLLEMKEENERFINRVKDTNEKQFSNVNQLQKALSAEESKQASKTSGQKQEKPGFSSRIESAVNIQAVRAYQKQNNKLIENDVLPEKTNQVVETRHDELKRKLQATELIKERSNNELLKESLLFQILIMKQQGFSIEEMAKRLNKGKAEIALLLKFHENTQE